MRAAPSLSSAIRATSLVTLASRLAGLARDVLLVRIFGNTAVGSAFMAAFAIPNLFRRLFGEGALAAAFLPQYAAAQREDPDGADRFASLTLGLLGLATGAITAAIELVLLALLLSLPHDAERALSIRLVMLMLPFMPFICVTAILAALLQVHGRFAAAASGPLLLNGFIIAAGLYSIVTGVRGGAGAAYVLGAATVLSGVTQAATFAWLLRGRVRWTRAVAGAWDRARVMVTRMVPVLVGLGTLQINALIDTVIAMWPIWVGPRVLGRSYPLDEGSTIILAASQRLYQFPLGVFGIAVATAAFPILARHAADPERFLDTLRRGIRLSLFLGLPASAGLALVRTDLVHALYRGGEQGFTAEGAARAAAVVLGYAPGIWAYSLNHVLTRGFYAKGDTTTPMKVAVSMVALNLALNLVLIWPLREAGLAWSTSLCAAVQCAVLWLLCRRLLPRPLIDPGTARAAARIILATAAMTIVVLGVAASAPAAETWRAHVISLLALTAVGGLTYIAGALLLGSPELRWLISRGDPRT